MRLYSRYVFRQAAGSFALILISLCSVVWIALALRQLNVVTSQGQDALTLIEITTLALPNLMAIIAPVAFLIACLHALNRMNTDSELIVMTASGATVWQTARPLLLLALLVSIGLAIVNQLLVPWSFRTLKTELITMRTDLLTQVIQPGLFTSPERGLTVHIRDRALNGELEGLVMHDTRNPKQSETYLAEHGVIVKQDNTAYLVMTNGHIIRRTDMKGPPQIVAFDKYAVDLDQFQPSGETAGEWKPRERYYSELIHFKPDCKTCARYAGQFRSEFNERLASPLYPIAFALIIVAFIGQARSTRSSRIQSLTIAFLAAVGLRLSGLALNNLVANSAVYVPAMYLVPIGAMILAIALIKAADRQRSGLEVIDKLADLTGRILAPVLSLFRRKPHGAQT